MQFENFSKYFQLYSESNQKPLHDFLAEMNQICFEKTGFWFLPENQKEREDAGWKI